ncbi:glycosyltransferase family 2 protein [uncultured Bacteroides sp.]|jgi:Glycosyltransferases involved in cell wall biogenesis|uniref:glycosyltransferase family 2 protein n=1 Tax=uncultured Bacteroides sp. TaxID=162156 RepID=UPI0026754766|nr:glycosyltransferase family 2 protein [uncultured Bacteroides sp.]
MLFVSFVLPAYKAAFLRQAIDSILAQSYTNFELIIVNDASPENLDEIVLSYSDERIRYYTNPENIGRKSLVAQWNRCIDLAEGEYLVLAADDDLYFPDFLRSCVDLAVKYPQVNLIRARVEQIDTDNAILGVDSLLPELTDRYEYFYYWVTGTSFTCIGNFMFKSSVLKEKRFIDYPYGYGSDTASCVMLSWNGVANTQEILFSFRISPIHLSGNKKYYKEKIRANTMLFSYLLRLNYPPPQDRFGLYYHGYASAPKLYAKCKYDYYHLAIKHLPFYKIHYIRECELLSFKDKCLILARFCLDKLLRK